jgi:DNA polymerase III subunit epsilon
MREIVFDTETTGLDPRDGHRIVEFAGIEMHDRVPTGRFLHLYFNPMRAMPAEAEAIHGLGDEFLGAQPAFAAKARELVGFLADSMLVAHNAPFDMRFLNFELARAGLDEIAPERVIDTLELARKRFPGAKHSLDALCLRFGIDRSARVKHGALIDSELLADVYIELTGGRQIGFAGFETRREAAPAEAVRVAREARTFTVPQEELLAHTAFVDGMTDPLWRKLESL